MIKTIPLKPIEFAFEFIASILARTWFYKVITPDNGIPENVIFAVWHENILPVAWHWKNAGHYAIASPSSDGRKLSSILQQWGFSIIAGSSNKKGLSAIRSAVRILRKKNNLVITPDGPRGPARKLKLGIIKISSIANTSIVPVTFSISRSWRLSSWDRFIIPKPFAKIIITYHAPLKPSILHSNDHIKVTELLSNILNNSD